MEPRFESICIVCGFYQVLYWLSTYLDAISLESMPLVLLFGD